MKHNTRHTGSVRGGILSPGLVLRVRDGAVRLFEGSIASDATVRLRHFLLRLRLRALGTFALTFGVYSVIISLLQFFFSNNYSSESGIYCGIGTALLSVPLLMSEGNIATSLTGSAVGNTICEFLGIRRETLGEYKLRGHASQSFVLGVLCGTLTFAFPAPAVLLSLIGAVAACIVLSVPEAGLLFSAAGLLYFGAPLHGVICAVTVFSFLFKLVRGKRSLRLRKIDAMVAVVLLLIASACFFTGGGVSGKDFFTSLIISVYFLAVLLLKDCRRISRLVAASVVFTGAGSALYVLGFAIERFTPAFAGTDSGFILEMAEKMPAFAGGYAPVILAALIPAAAGTMVRPNSCVSRLTSFLSLISMCLCLTVCGGTRELFAAGVATVLMMLVVGRRIVYASLSVLFAGGVLLMYLGETGQAVYSFALRHIASDFAYNASAFSSVSAGITAAGSGYSGESLFSGGTGADFWHSLYLATGVCGIAVFAAAVIVLCVHSVLFFRRTAHITCTSEELRRFGAVLSAADMRIGAGAPLCAVISMLICGTFTNIWSSAVTFMLFWLLCGVCAAYIRSAQREIVKAELAPAAAFSPDAAAVDISVRRDDDMIRGDNRE